MTEPNLSVRELQEQDIPLIVDYWLHSDPEHLQRMGVDLTKIPTADQLQANLLTQLNRPIEQKMAYCIIWLLDDKPIGHCNTNPTRFGEEAFMHLHIWQNQGRQKGIGTQLVKLTLPWFFNKLQLKKLYCQPYALNPAPNRTLEKLGFKFVKEYITVPGSLNFEQAVYLWELSVEEFRSLR